MRPTKRPPTPVAIVKKARWHAHAALLAIDDLAKIRTFESFEHVGVLAKALRTIHSCASTDDRSKGTALAALKKCGLA